MIKFSCPSCGADYEVDDGLAGQKASCAGCGVKFVVPTEPALEGYALVAALAEGAPPPASPVSMPAELPVNDDGEDDVIRIRAPGRRPQPRRPRSQNTGNSAPRRSAGTATPRKRRPGPRERGRGQEAPRSGIPRRHVPPVRKKSSSGAFVFLSLLFLLVAVAAGFVFYNKKKSGAPKPPLSLDVPQDASTSRDQSLSSTPKSVPPKPKLRRVGGTPLERYGMLSVKGNTIVDEEGKPVVLRGMSLFHCMDGKKYYNRECVKWLRDDWKCDVVRIAIMTDFSWPNSWANEPEAVWNRVVTVGDACIEFGLYFIVDYHGGGPPLPHLAQAKKFFKRLAEKYGKTPNLIYETYNEPYGKKGTTLTWSEGVKPYQDAVIGLIRSMDPDNLVMVGTPDFCLHPSHVIADPLKFKNIVYVAHCYAATHKQGLRNDIQKTLDAGYPVFLTEFGTCEYTGSGKLDAVSVSKWMKFMGERKIGWCNWSLNDKDETASALRLRADPKGGWPVNGLRPSGVLIRSYLRSAAKKRAWERR